MDYVDDYRPGARRFDCGEFPQFLSVPMAQAALSQLVEWGVDRIHGTLTAVTGSIERKARDLGWRAAQPFDRAGHMLGLSFAHGMPRELNDELGRRGIHLAVRGDSLRISPHLHTTEEDIDVLIEGLATCT